MKSVFLLLFLVNLAYAQFQTIRIGNIDKHYQNSLSKEQLRVIIDEIENLFESQLGFNVFDYSQDGKPIDIVYIPASKKKKKLLQNQRITQSLKNKMDKILLYIDANTKSIQSAKKELTNKYAILNQSIEKLNLYVENMRQSINKISTSEYKSMNEYISHETKIIKKKTSSLKKEEQQFNRNTTRLKQKIRQYNLLAKKYNRLNRDIEKLSKTMIEIKGVTKAQTQTIYTSYKEGGETTLQKSINMQKIEIYDFENLQLLKVILAHELGHLVGVDHINATDALMNPLLQEKQLTELSLTYDDIQGFYEALLVSSE